MRKSRAAEGFRIAFRLEPSPKSWFLDPNECNFSFTEAIFLTRMLLPSRFSLQNGFLFFLYIKLDPAAPIEGRVKQALICSSSQKPGL